MTPEPGRLLEVEDLNVTFPGVPRSAHNVSFTLDRGELLGLVGESGSGKTVSVLALLGLLPGNAVVSGTVRFAGEELLNASRERLRSTRGREIAIVFQDPLSALNPGLTVGSQLNETLRLLRPRLDRQRRRARSIQLLAEVGLPDGVNLLRRFPHELSGGMRQRVLIAVALAGDPQVILADEPTTALDVTLAAEILDLLDELRAQRNLAAVLVSHDLNLVASRCDSVVVMYRGEVVERAAAQEIFAAPTHPYTRMLIGNTLDPFVPRALADAPRGNSMSDATGDGCVYAARCGLAEERCRHGTPPTVATSPGHWVACRLVTESP